MGRLENCRAAVFDLDGTLLRSNHVWSGIDEKFLGKRGFEVPGDYFKVISVMNLDQAAVYTRERFGLEDSIESIRQEWTDMAIYEYSHVIGEVDGAADFLRLLKSRGVKIALATASLPELYEPALKRLGMYPQFDAFATTAEVERGKGFPDVYELACRRLGEMPEDTVVFEDIIEGVRGARAGGFGTAACLNSHYAADRDKLIAESDLSFESYRELM
ncbi:MAG: HAD family phosphatase [Ruminococcus sp.]|nr:HAD family phosphatase [Ruminococcus sp.]